MVPDVRREFFGPSDCIPMSPDDFDNACRICDTIVALRDGRADYLTSRGLDERTYLPAHMWGQPFVESNFAKIARKDYRTINHLRCLTYNFTGYQLLTMSAAEGTPEVLEIPADVDDVIRRAASGAKDAAVQFVHSIRGLPADRIVSTPRMFGESGWDVGGTIVNWDTWSNQQRINGLHGTGVLDMLKACVAERGYARIVEIGAGYGNLARSLEQMVGPIDYTILDLPESLIYSSVYLNSVRGDQNLRIAEPGVGLGGPGAGMTMLSNHLLEEFLPQVGEVDLVINVMSLSEMAPHQVAYYRDAVRQLIGDRGLFYEQNYLLPGTHTDLPAILGAGFPYGVEAEDTVPGHRGRGVVRMWANRYCELWDRGGIRSIIERNAVLSPATRAESGTRNRTSATVSFTPSV